MKAGMRTKERKKEEEEGTCDIFAAPLKKDRQMILVGGSWNCSKNVFQCSAAELAALSNNHELVHARAQIGVTQTEKSSSPFPRHGQIVHKWHININVAPASRLLQGGAAFPCSI